MITIGVYGLMLKLAADAAPALLSVPKLNPLQSMITNNEKFSPEAYRLPNETYPTIGYGTRLSPDIRPVLSKLFGQNLNYQKLVSTNQPISEPQGRSLLDYMINSKSNILASKVPNLPKLPSHLRNQMIDSSYQGSLLGSRKTLDLINKNKWTEASKQFLNNQEYKNATKLGVPGVRPRMEALSNAMSEFGRTNKTKLTIGKPTNTPIIRK